ncbi:hypothetical protein BDV93DRAFT_565077 [Ceratobasidium sp. AG-I]|nr:hypothetical protein BDV93DRAFT_565077 [Ceratobasidium sp. AG-I]
MHIFSSALGLPTLEIAFTDVNILGWSTIHALDVCIFTIRSIHARTTDEHATRPSFHETSVPFVLMLNRPWHGFLRYQPFCSSVQLPVSPPGHFPNAPAQYGLYSRHIVLGAIGVSLPLWVLYLPTFASSTGHLGAPGPVKNTRLLLSLAPSAPPP